MSFPLRRPTRASFLLAAILFTVLPGCSALRQDEPKILEVYSLDQKPLCRVAILPFQNETSNDQGALIVYRVFVAEMNSLTKIMVVPEGDIRHIYRQLHIYPSHSLDSEKIRILADRLGADALITGKVTEMREEKQGDSVNPIIGINIQMLDAATGKIINSTYHKRDGDHYRMLMHFGKISTVTELSKYMAREIIQALEEKGIHSCR